MNFGRKENGKCPLRSEGYEEERALERLGKEQRTE